MRSTSNIDPGRRRAEGGLRARAARAALAVAIIALPFAMFHFVVPFAGTKTIGNDYVRFPLPQQMELQYSIAHGTWPLYAPGFAGGRPAAALTLGQPWHPISHLAARLPGYWDGHALDWTTALRLLTLGLAHLALVGALGRLGLRRGMAFLVAFVTVYNMRMLDAFRFGAALENYTGMLFVCAAAVHLFFAEGRLGPAAATIGATFLLAVGGHPQMMYFGFLGVGIFVGAAPLVLPALAGAPPVAPRKALRFYGVAALCLAAGCAIAAAYLVPLYFDFVAEAGIRAARSYRWSLVNSDSIGGLLNSFFSPLDASVTGAFGGSSLVVLALFAPLLVKGAGRARLAPLVLFALGALAFAVSLGRATPLHRWAWQWLPFFDAFRIPGRISFVLPVVLMLLLAWIFGWRGDARVELRGRTLPLTWSGALALLSLVAFGAYRLWLGDLLPRPARPIPMEFGHIPPAALRTILGLGVGTLAVVAARGLFPRAARILGAVLALAVVVETGVVLRYGTWIDRRKDTPSLARMDRDKQRDLSYRSTPGIGMQSDIVAKRMKSSFLDPNLAVFYRKHVSVGGEEAAFGAMARTRSADEIIVEGFGGGGARAPSGSRSPDGVVLTRATFNDMAFTVNNGAPGFLSYTALDRKGRWRAAVDGRPARIYAANGGEQAVYLEPGRHEVAFSFDSPAARFGVAASLAALAAVGAFFSLRRTRSLRRALCALGCVGGAAAAFVAWNGALHGGDDLKTRYSWSSDALPDPDNLAFGRTAKMSSKKQRQHPYGCYAGRGVDGDTRHSGFATDREKTPPWWQVDLGSRRAIGRIDVHRGSAVPRRGAPPFDVLMSDDGKSFRKIAIGEARAQDQMWRIQIVGERARYVQLRSRKPGSLTLAEIEVFAPAADVGKAGPS